MQEQRKYEMDKTKDSTQVPGICPRRKISRALTSHIGGKVEDLVDVLGDLDAVVVHAEIDQVELVTEHVLL